MKNKTIASYFVLSLIIPLIFAMPMSAEQLAVADDIAISCEVEDTPTVGINPRGIPCDCGGIFFLHSQTTIWGFTGHARIVPGSSPPIMEREQTRSVTSWFRCFSCGIITTATGRNEFKWIR